MCIHCSSTLLELTVQNGLNILTNDHQLNALAFCKNFVLMKMLIDFVILYFYRENSPGPLAIYEMVFNKFL